MTGLCFTVACPHCRTRGGQPLAVVRRADPNWASRERRAVVECERCGYTGTVVVQLVDAVKGRTA